MDIDWSLLFIIGSSTMLVGMLATLFIKEPKHKATEEKIIIQQEL